MPGNAQTASPTWRDALPVREEPASGREIYTMADVEELEESLPDLGPVVFKALREVVQEREGDLTSSDGEQPGGSEPDTSAAADGQSADQSAPTPTRGAKKYAEEIGFDLSRVTKPTGKPDDDNRPKATKKDIERVLEEGAG